MDKANRLIGLFFGALLVVAFFLPWVTVGVDILSFSVTGYDIVRGVSKVEKVFGSEFNLLNYFIVLFPLTGIVSVIFSGVIRAPILTLAAAMGTVAYTAFRIADVGWDSLERSSGMIGMGLWISLVCLLVVFVNSAMQAATGDGKKKKKK